MKWTARILLVMRLKQQETSSLCRQIYEEGRTREWPGLGEEVSEICREIGIPDVNEVLVLKSEIKKAIHQHHSTTQISRRSLVSQRNWIISEMKIFLRFKHTSIVNLLKMEGCPSKCGRKWCQTSLVTSRISSRGKLVGRMA